MFFSWWSIIFICCICIGVYFTYFRPHVNTFNELKNDPDFINAMLVFESNSEFDHQSFKKLQKHIKLFMIYYSEKSDVCKLKKQKGTIIRYANKMLKNIPPSMRRYSFQINAISLLDNILSKYIDIHK